MSEVIDQNSITFGKYKDLTLSHMLRDRKYCTWLLDQEWFRTQYEYLYNRVKEYDPKKYFFECVTTLPVSTELKKDSLQTFLDSYQYFHLVTLDKLSSEIVLTSTEKKCYEFYIESVNNLKYKIQSNLSDNPYDIKAPTAWLQKLEKNHGIPRAVFKEFLSAYELPNIPYIVEDIKKMGGIDYKGARSFLIAKNNSVIQENFWGEILKKKYGQFIGVQFQLNNNFFDFYNIKTNTVYECKIGLKDFNDEQYNKYTSIKSVFRIIYLISTDCIIDIENRKIYTNNPENYKVFFETMNKKISSKEMIRIISGYEIIKINNVEEYF